MVLDSRVFTLTDQNAFAELSGDFNPMHVDPERARRTLFGFPVVHGVHGVLWALDCLLRGRSAPVAIAGIRAKFHNPIPLDTLTTVSLLEEDQDGCSLSIGVNGEQATLMHASFTRDIPAGAVANACQPYRRTCAELDSTQAGAAAGILSLAVDEELLHKILPVLSQCLPAIQIAELLATTRLVGMECPGLHSLYLSLNLISRETPEPGAGLAFLVKRSIPKLGSVELEVTGPTMQGVLATIVRPRPQPQPSMDDVQAAISAGSLAAQRAVVVGGSRGIGEVTAKCIAAGGGSVVITYLQGKDDADRVVDEITRAGGSAAAVRVDCTQLSPETDRQLAVFGAPSHLYYFATPRIPVNKMYAFQSAVYRDLSRYYVEAFAELVERLYRRGESLTVMYPSTIFLDEPKAGTGEYCAAKAAGEALCRHLQKALPKTRFHTPRLPRMRTDQTSGIIPGRSLEALDVIAGILKRIEDGSELAV